VGLEGEAFVQAHGADGSGLAGNGHERSGGSGSEGRTGVVWVGWFGRGRQGLGGLRGCGREQRKAGDDGGG
jgi:hypothetical protein